MQQYIMIEPKSPPVVSALNMRQRELLRRARTLQKRRQLILEEKLLAQASKRHHPAWLQAVLHH